MSSDSRISRAAAALDADADVVFAYLFGSQATGRATRASDIDLAAYVRDGVDTFEGRLRLLGVLERALGTDAVDLIVLNDAPISLTGRILTTRAVLVDRAPAIRHAWESLTARQFADFRVREHRLLQMAARG